jgi:hypothetical protein
LTCPVLPCPVSDAEATAGVSCADAAIAAALQVGPAVPGGGASAAAGATCLRPTSVCHCVSLCASQVGMTHTCHHRVSPNLTICQPIYLSVSQYIHQPIYLTGRRQPINPYPSHRAAVLWLLAADWCGLGGARPPQGGAVGSAAGARSAPRAGGFQCVDIIRLAAHVVVVVPDGTMRGGDAGCWYGSAGVKDSKITRNLICSRSLISDGRGLMK